MTRSISAAAKAPLGKRILKNWQLYLFVLPAVAYFIIFKYVPLYGIQIAFRNYKAADGFFGSEWVGLAHFIRFFRSYYFGTVIRNTLTITGLSLLLGFPVPILFALLHRFCHGIGNGLSTFIRKMNAIVQEPFWVIEG